MTVQKTAEFAGFVVGEARIKSAIEAGSAEKAHATMRSWIIAKKPDFHGGISADGQTNWRDVLSGGRNAVFVDHAGELLERFSHRLD